MTKISTSIPRIEREYEIDLLSTVVVVPREGLVCRIYLFFFFNDTATTEIYTLSLHDALPICWPWRSCRRPPAASTSPPSRSEEHTSELQSRENLVCRLLLEKKKHTRFTLIMTALVNSRFVIPTNDKL